MTTARRAELALLVACAALGGLGLALVMAATDQPLSWALRGLTPAGALLLAAVLIDLVNGPRDRLLLPLCGVLTTLSVVFVSRTDMLLAPASSSPSLWAPS